MKKLVSIYLLIILFSIAALAQDNPDQPLETQNNVTDFKSDGCTLFPDGNYNDCCFAHDQEYYSGGSWQQRWQSDKKLFQCVAAKPRIYNKLAAPLMWLGVRVGGVPWLKTSFRWGFGKNKAPAVKIRKPAQSSRN